jgi:hypothetical protein
MDENTPTTPISVVGGLCFNACFSQLEPKPPSGGADKNVQKGAPNYVFRIMRFFFWLCSFLGPIVPDARKFLKVLYKSSRERNWETGSGQPQIQSTWNTLFASTYWDMRLSMACTAMSAEVVGQIIARDFNSNLVTDGSRQPLSDPNSPACGNLRRGGNCGAF